jgi:hypothetical protein
MAFMVVHAGVSIAETKNMTLREYRAIMDVLREKQ